MYSIQCDDGAITLAARQMKDGNDPVSRAIIPISLWETASIAALAAAKFPFACRSLDHDSRPGKLELRGILDWESLNETMAV